MALVNPGMMCMAQDFQPEVVGYGYVLVDMSGTEHCLPAYSLDYGVTVPMEWVPSVVPGMQACPGATYSKALTIRDPKTGEIVTLNSSPAPQTEKPAAETKLSEKEKWMLAAESVAKRMRAVRLKADRSTFSALNLDGVRDLKASKGSQNALKSSGKLLTVTVPMDPVMPRQEPAEKVERRPLPVATPAIKKAAVKSSIMAPRIGDMLTPAAAASLAALCLDPGSVGQPRKRALKVKIREPCEEDDAASEEQLTSAGESDFTVQSRENSDAFSGNGETVEPEEDQATEEPICTLANRSHEQVISWLVVYRHCSSEVKPVELATMSIAEVDVEKPSPKVERKGSAVSLRSRSGSNNSLSGTSTPQGFRTLALWAVDDSRLGALKRSVQSLLNKVCPESVTSIAEKIAEIKVEDAAELDHIIGLVFRKAVTEPHYMETYADLIFSLNTAFPHFPNPEGGKPLTFKTILLNSCQNEFENLPLTLAPTAEEVESFDAEELEFRRKKIKERVLANMKLIGHLFLRQLLPAKVICSIIQELTGCGDAEQIPEEHVIESALELLLSIGFTLESMPCGEAVIGQVCGRLKDLKQQKGPDGRALLSKRLQFSIQDFLDTRCAGWTRKVFNGIAKTKEEIRLQQERELQAQAKGREVQVGQRVVLGKRPEYLASKSA